MGEQSFPCVKRKKSGNPENKTEIERRRQMAEFTHFKKDGSAVMVDVHEKPDTYRAASATGTIQVSPEVFAAVRDHTAKKGDVLGVARLAGIMGAKKNAELIPLCHIVPLTNCEVTFTTDENTNSITAVCTTSCVVISTFWKRTAERAVIISIRKRKNKAWQKRKISRFSGWEL